VNIIAASLGVALQVTCQVQCYLSSAVLLGKCSATRQVQCYLAGAMHAHALVHSDGASPGVALQVTEAEHWLFVVCAVLSQLAESVTSASARYVVRLNCVVNVLPPVLRVVRGPEGTRLSRARGCIVTRRLTGSPAMQLAPPVPTNLHNSSSSS
jgi:hypothetical protein